MPRSPVREQRDRRQGGTHVRPCAHAQGYEENPYEEILAKKVDPPIQQCKSVGI